MSNFGFEKLAREATPIESLVAGFETTGKLSTEQGFRNIRRPRKHLPYQIAGGAVGGAVILPSATMGAIKGVKGAVLTPGGPKKKLSAAIRGAVSGLKMPAKALIGAARPTKGKLPLAQRMARKERLVEAAAGTGVGAVFGGYAAGAQYMKGREFRKRLKEMQR